MKKRVIRYFICLFITFILLILCTALCKIWEGEDWIGTYYGINLNEQYTLWTGDAQGKDYSIQDNVAYEDMPSGIDSVQVVGNCVIGHCSKGYFLLDMTAQRLAYFAAKPIGKYWNNDLTLIPSHAYYQQRTRKIDIICALLFLISTGMVWWWIAKPHKPQHNLA